MLYHYTSATLLEKIITNGKLLPSGHAGWRLLWATSSPTIDPTATCAHKPIVARFSLHSCDFKPWTSVRSRFQQERFKDAERMEQRIARLYGMVPENWYVRYASLSADRWLRIETRDQRWQPYVSSTWRPRPQLFEMDDEALADHRYRYQTEEEED